MCMAGRLQGLSRVAKVQIETESQLQSDPKAELTTAGGKSAVPVAAAAVQCERGRRCGSAKQGFLAV